MNSIVDLFHLVVGYIIPFLFLLTVLVFIHEYGHYSVAKACGVKIEAFSIGFGQELFGWFDKHGTRWKVCLIPLGGYVKMLGETTTGADSDTAANDQSFAAKKLWQRAAIVIAGPAANFLFAICVLWIQFMLWGQQVTTSKIGKVLPDTPAAVAGLQAGDDILAIDGTKVSRFEEVMAVIAVNTGKSVQLTYARDGAKNTIAITPTFEKVKTELGSEELGSLGILPHYPPVAVQIVTGSPAEKAGMKIGDTVIAIDGQPIFDFADIQAIVFPKPNTPMVVTVQRGNDTLDLNLTTMAGKDAEGKEIGQLGLMRTSGERKIWRNPVVAFGKSVRQVWDISATNLVAVGQMIVGQRSADALGGPIRIAQMSGEMAKLGWVRFIELMVMISISLGLINLFPIPTLDGGHLAMYGVELVIGKPVNVKIQEWAFKVGLAFIIGLALFALRNDVMHLLTLFNRS